MFMQIRGVLVWQCPNCLQVNRNTMTPLRYKLKCSNRNCDRRWVAGMLLFALAGQGTHPQPPPDLIAMDGGIWRGGRIFRVICDACSAVIREHFPPPTKRWPSPYKGSKIFDTDGYAEPSPDPDLKDIDEEGDDKEEST